ncbi:MAG: nucleotidyltransferase [Holophagales bacterium]|nr:nucleotidyltransferase [Holophagales bacterium]
MSANDYLRGLLQKYAAPVGPAAPVLLGLGPIQDVIRRWAGSQLLGMALSGSYAKGTAVRGDADVDLFISLSPTTKETLREIYTSLLDRLREENLRPREKNVCRRVTSGGFSIDLVPAKKQAGVTPDHSLWVRKRATWQQTNIDKHIALVRGSGRREEIILLKVWRDQQRLDFPSIYLELCVIRALSGRPFGDLASNVLLALQFFSDAFVSARIQDPANSNNVISDDLTNAEKALVQAAAARSLQKKTWQEVIS